MPRTLTSRLICLSLVDRRASKAVPLPEKEEENIPSLPSIILLLQCAKAALWDSGQFRSIDPIHSVRVNLGATMTDVVWWHTEKIFHHFTQFLWVHLWELMGWVPFPSFFYHLDILNCKLVKKKKLGSFRVIYTSYCIHALVLEWMELGAITKMFDVIHRQVSQFNSRSTLKDTLPHWQQLLPKCIAVIFDSQ